MFEKAMPGNDLEVRGKWWIPGRASKKIPGTLKISTTYGGSLELLGVLPRDTRIKGFPVGLTKQEIINGITTTGYQITLVDCHETYIAGNRESRIRASMVVTDIHAKSPSQIKFNEVYVQYTHLSEWMFLDAFDIKWDAESEKYEVVCEKPDSPTFKVGDDFDITFWRYIEAPSYYPIQTSIEMAQKTAVIIRSKKHALFQDFRRMIDRIRMLLSLGMQRPVYPDRLWGSSTRNVERRGEKKYPVTMDVYFHQMERQDSEPPRAPDDMLFTYSALQKEFGEVLIRLLTQYENMRPLFESHVSRFYLPRIYLEQRFLRLTIGIEQFHRSIRSGTELPKSEWRKQLREIEKAASPKYRRWLREKLQFSNEITLKQRLTELLDQYHVALVGYYGSKESFIRKIVDTRNYLVHGSEHLKKKAAEATEMIYLSGRLELISEACLLCELGLDQRKVRGLFQQAGRFLNKYSTQAVTRQ